MQSIYIGYAQLLLVSVYFKNWILNPSYNLHANPRFLARSFVVRDHLRFNSEGTQKNL